MVTKTAWCANNNMGTCREIATLTTHVHTANAAGNMCAAIGIEPSQFGFNLQSKFTGWCNYQSQRLGSFGEPTTVSQKAVGHSQTEGNGFARSGLGGYQQIALSCIRIQNSSLNGCQALIATIVKGSSQGWMHGIMQGHEDIFRDCIPRSLGSLVLGHIVPYPDAPPASEMSSHSICRPKLAFKSASSSRVRPVL